MVRGPHYNEVFPRLQTGARRGQDGPVAISGIPLPRHSVIVDFDARTRTPLIFKESLSRLEILLCEMASDFLGDTLVLTGDESVPIQNRQRINITHPGWLLQCTNEDLDQGAEGVRQWAAYLSGSSSSALKHKLASLFFVSPDLAKELFIGMDERPLVKQLVETHFGNWLTLGCQQHDLTGAALRRRCLAVANKLYDNRLFDYGRCCVKEEFDNSNLDRTNGGLRAVGLDVSKRLPGFYWGNYFGEYLCDVIEKMRY
jgi:hypothetical protein